MKQPFCRGACGLGTLIIALALVAGAVPGAGAEGRQPFERVATIQLKGASGSLDHLLVDAKHARLLLANQSNDTLDVVDLRTNELVKQIPGQKEIHGIAYASNLDRVFVGNGGSGVCNALDARDYSVLGSVPVKDADNVHYDPRTNHVFVAGEKDMAVIDPPRSGSCPPSDCPRRRKDSRSPRDSRACM
jgi:DNA-binding beta-propeller fold protein YncE